jgi:hypothetical protein
MIAKATNRHMMRRGWHRCSRVAALPFWAAVLTACLSSPALSQHNGVTPFGLTEADRAKVMAARPNWSGLWGPVGGLVFDPGTADPKGNNAQQPGDREHPPYNAEWEAIYRAKLDHTLAGYFRRPDHKLPAPRHAAPDGRDPRAARIRRHARNNLHHLGIRAAAAPHLY